MFMRTSRRVAALALAMLTLTLGACGATSSTATAAATATTTSASAAGLLFLQETTGVSSGIGQQTTLYALNATTSAQVWSAQLRGGTQTAALLIGGALYVNSIEIISSTTGTPGPQSVIDHLYVFDARSGHLLHQFDTPNTVYIQLFAAGQTLIGVKGSLTQLQSPSSLLLLVAINPATNAEIWHHPISNAGQIVVTGNTVVQEINNPGTSTSPNSTTTLNAFRVSDGQQLWTHTVDQNVFSVGANASSIVLGVLNAPTTSSGIPNVGVTALSNTDGTQSWSKTFNGPGLVLGISDTSVIVGLQGTPTKSGGVIRGSLAALNASTGAQAWTSPFEVNNTLAITSTAIIGLASPTAGGSTAAIPSVFALNPATGATLWNTALNGNEGATALVASDATAFALLSMPSNMVVQAVNVANGALLWQFPLQGTPQVNLLVG